MERQDKYRLNRPPHYLPAEREEKKSFIHNLSKAAIFSLKLAVRVPVYFFGTRRMQLWAKEKLPLLPKAHRLHENNPAISQKKYKKIPKVQLPDSYTQYRSVGIPDTSRTLGIATKVSISENHTSLSHTPRPHVDVQSHISGIHGPAQKKREMAEDLGVDVPRQERHARSEAERTAQLYQVFQIMALRGRSLAA